MISKAINASDAPVARGGYSQAVEVTGATRTLWISGQVPVTTDDAVPESFAEQCRLAWANLEAQLRAAGMTFANLVKVTTLLADRRFAVENRQIRTEVLAGHAPAMTLIVAGLFDAAWLIEIEAVAVA